MESICRGCYRECESGCIQGKQKDHLDIERDLPICG